MEITENMDIGPEISVETVEDNPNLDIENSVKIVDQDCKSAVETGDSDSSKSSESQKAKPKKKIKSKKDSQKNLAVVFNKKAIQKSRSTSDVLVVGLRLVRSTVEVLIRLAGLNVFLMMKMRLLLEFRFY